MDNLKEIMRRRDLAFGRLTLGELCALAAESGLSAGEMAVREAAEAEGLSEAEIGPVLWRAFEHNLLALQMGLEDEGQSFLFGQAAREISAPGGPPLAGPPLLDKAVRYTLATQAGNHCVGLKPCAGTGDACPYTGLARALREEVTEPGLVIRALAVMLKIGVWFRVAKTTTGCNLEGFGAGAAATAAALSEIWGSGPEKTAQAVTLALSPTIGVPCTPRVMVPGLCATHIGGAIMIGWLAASLSRYSNLPVNVPVDLMMAMAAAVHPVSGQQLVPVVIQYMEPFFKINQEVEARVSPEVRAADTARREAVTRRGLQEAKAIAAQADSILRPFGEVVVGGSSQAVGSPANTARLAHALARGPVTKIIIELYPELFARRAINVPAIIMSGAYGVDTQDALGYKTVMERTRAEGLEVEIKETPEYQVQKISLETPNGLVYVKALNRGGARLALVDSSAGRDQALAAAAKLGLVVVDA